MKRCRIYATAIALLCFGTGCSRKAKDDRFVPGYLEAELLEIASPEAGYLKTLAVARGQSVKAGEMLFELDTTALEIGREETEQDALAILARLEDARTGLRPDELEELEAQLEEAKAGLLLATKMVERERLLFKDRVATQASLDQAESSYIQAQKVVQSLEARLRLAHEGAREFQKKALEREAASVEARNRLSQWHTEQARRLSAVDSYVQDTLYEEGEWVPPSRPVVLLRAKDLLKARFFLTAEQLRTIQLGSSVNVQLPGDATLISATVERVSDFPEYTPPIIFSREQSAKLVFLVEARLPPDWARKLHPGMPVSVQIK